jgi:hypothetical protein
MWGRKLYYQDSYGRIHRDRKAERTANARPAGSGPSLMRIVWTVLIVLAVLMVLASLHH